MDTYLNVGINSFIACFIIKLYVFSAGFSEDSDYTSDFNFPVNGQIPNAATSQYLPVALQAQGNQPTPGKGFTIGILFKKGIPIRK